MLYFENKAKRDGFSVIIGVDEVGRGSLAGPVVAAAVSLRKTAFTAHICDSKKITPRQRETAFQEIFANAYVGVGIMSEAVIDTVNILQATYHAMSRAVENLISTLPPPRIQNADFVRSVCILVDGPSFKTELPYAYAPIVGGDSASMSIACASIVAKVIRDRMLAIYDKIFPHYGFKKHKGYATLQHRAALKEHGASLIHRKTFKYCL